jgi:hypothetical protein
VTKAPPVPAKKVRRVTPMPLLLRYHYVRINFSFYFDFDLPILAKPRPFQSRGS